MSYLGPFTGQYREQMLEEWKRESLALGIPLSGDYSLVQTLGDPVEIRKWGLCGLPGDSVSIDNAIFATKSSRVPMLIDPQFQGNSWLKKMFRDTTESKFTVAKVSRVKDDGNKADGALQAVLE